MTQPDVQATLQARFVDDDTIVRTGRALLEVDGYGWVVVPVPAGWAEQVQAVLDAAVEADTISSYVQAAEAAAESAEDDRVVVEQAATSASWSGDRLTVLGATSPPLTGPQGERGPEGPAGAGTGDVLWSELTPILDGKASTAQVEARTPEIRVVSSPDLATSPGVLYVVMEG